MAADKYDEQAREVFYATYRPVLPAAEARRVIADALRAARIEGMQTAGDVGVRIIGEHCCVSSCCDAQPSAGDARELANCLRAAIDRAIEAARKGEG